MKTVTAKKAREQLTCTGQSEGDIVFRNQVIGTMSCSEEKKGKVLYASEITSPVTIRVSAPKRNALLDKVAKALSVAINSGQWPA